MKKGDIVVRKSYNKDLYFVVSRLKDGIAYLRCISHRLKADAPISDLISVKGEGFFGFKKLFHDDIAEKVKNIVEEREDYRHNYLLPGKVLHIDADEGYLNMCLTYYEALKVPCVGALLKEIKQPDKITELLNEHLPDVLVLTGHDAIKKGGDSEKLESYRSSAYFVEAVRKARQFQSAKDGLFIFAGACQSSFEDIMNAGANFASSPERIFIHALDPVLIAEKIAYTSVNDTISLKNVIQNTITGESGIGGIESRGTLRKVK